MFDYPVLVVDSLTSEGILGLDFLQKHKCVVNLDKGTLQFLWHNLKISLKSHVTHADRIMSQVNVVVAHTICIPQQSELEILANASENKYSVPEHW